MRELATIPLPMAGAAAGLILAMCGAVYIFAAVRDWDALRELAQWNTRYARSPRWSFLALGVALVVCGGVGMLVSILRIAG